jgi:uncharacterized membrane protein YgdD (TMEM256/DUF423 family)
MCCSKSWTMIGGVFAGLAVVLGAFAAHGLDAYLVKKHGEETREVAGQTIPASAKYLAVFRTGATYQMYHALGLIAVGLLAQSRPGKSLQIAAWCFVLGIVLFSGALYIIAIEGPYWQGIRWGLVAPVGGMAYILGWLAFAIGACPCGARSPRETVSLN